MADYGGGRGLRPCEDGLADIIAICSSSVQLFTVLALLELQWVSSLEPVLKNGKP